MLEVAIAGTPSVVERGCGIPERVADAAEPELHQRQSRVPGGQGHIARCSTERVEPSADRLLALDAKDTVSMAVNDDPDEEGECGRIVIARLDRVVDDRVRVLESPEQLVGEPEPAEDEVRSRPTGRRSAARRSSDTAA